jgi:hypothetical protein
MKTNDGRGIPQAELNQLALKLREDLVNLPETAIRSPGLFEVMDSACALIVAILEPEQPCLHDALPSKKTVEPDSFPLRRRIVPMSLH